MGELLRETERAVGTDKGGRQYVDGNRLLPSSPPPTLAELGLTGSLPLDRSFTRPDFDSRASPTVKQIHAASW
jgi:hypothetical protein